MRWTTRDYLSAAVGIAVGLALLSVYGLQWWIPVVAIISAPAAMVVIR